MRKRKKIFRNRDEFGKRTGRREERKRRRERERERSGEREVLGFDEIGAGRFFELATFFFGKGE
jgi:hypothetical protein